MSRASRIKQASADTYLHYAAQDDVLRAAIQQAYKNRESAKNAARTQSAGVLGAISDTLPAAKRIYKQQGAQQQLAADVYGKDVAGLGNVASSIQAGAALERRNATDSLSQARSATLTGLTGQRVQARAGRQFAIQKAGTDFASEIHDILSQQKSLAAQKGAYLTSQLQSLSQAAADRALKQGSLGETRRHNKAAEQTAAQNADTAAGKAKDKGKPKYATPTQQGAVQDGIKLAINDVKRLLSVSSSLTRDQIEQVLLVGDPQSGIKAVKPLLASTALDVVFKGHIGHKNVRELRKRRIRVHRLGYKVRAPQAQFLPPSGQTVHVGGLNVPVG